METLVIPTLEILWGKTWENAVSNLIFGFQVKIAIKMSVYIRSSHIWKLTEKLPKVKQPHLADDNNLAPHKLSGHSVATIGTVFTSSSVDGEGYALLSCWILPNK